MVSCVTVPLADVTFTITDLTLVELVLSVALAVMLMILDWLPRTGTLKSPTTPGALTSLTTKVDVEEFVLPFESEAMIV